MTRIVRTLLTIVAFASLPIAAENFCMDCTQRQIRHDDPNIWYESEAMCCMYPCYPTEFVLKQADVGSGCQIAEANNDLVQGTICNSTSDDQGCPQQSPPPQQTAASCDGGTCYGSPIIIDIGDRAYQLTSAADGVLFDLQTEGTRRQMAWTRLGAENAFLALDRNQNGHIDNGGELFGDYTLLRAGQRAQNGFEALAELDGNGDGAVDARDASWQALVLWTDRNHDGTSSPDELQPIAGSSVIALETTYRPVGRKDQWRNEFRYTAHLRLREGESGESRRAYYDVFLSIE